MAMPAARLLQAVRVAGEAEAQEYERARRASLHDAAFIGWQVYASQPRLSERDERMGFDAWLRMFGISADGKAAPPPETVEDWRARCLAVGERVRQMDQRVH